MMTRTWFATRCCGLALLLLLASSPVQAGAIAPCDDPRVFSDAAVNAVILPYRYTGQNRDRVFGEAAQRLTRLLQLEILFSLIKYGSIGAVELELQQNAPSGCQVDEVLARLTDGSGPGRLQQGHGLALLWGRIYEEGKDIYVQSYLKFLRRGVDETLAIGLPGTDGTGNTFVGRLPAQAIAFAPRRLTRADLQTFIAEFEQAAVIRPQPDLAVSGKPLAAWSPWQRFAYWVTEVRGDWMHIQAQGEDTAGWVRAHSDPSAWPLRRKLPELAFLDAVAGYLRYQVGRDVAAVSAAQPATAEQVAAALDFFAQGAPEPLASAVGQALRGFLLLRAGQDSAGPRPDLIRLDSDRSAAVSQAAGYFTQARRLIPYNAEARNLDFLGQLLLAAKDPPTGEYGAALVQDLLDAVAVEPDNRNVLANLAELYRYFQEIPARSPYPAAELTQRLLSVEQIRRAASP